MNTITFEIGDVAHCTYYNYTGIITEFKQAHGMDFIRLHNPNLPAAHICDTRIETNVSGRLYPHYLQLVCKKADYEALAVRTIFGRPD